MNSKKIRKYTYIVSILLHILFLLSFKPLSHINIFNAVPDNAEIKEDEKRITFELVETPDYAPNEKPDDPTSLLSDKSTRARDQNRQKDKNLGMPFAQGDLEDMRDIRSYSEPSPENQLINPAPKQAEQEQQFEEYADAQDFKKLNENFSKFSRQALMGKENESQLKRPTYKNEKFNAEDIGGLSFNTYDWDFAPYMLAMKRKVERNVFPPPAFTHMGLISGETVLRFKVYPSGEMKDLKVLEYKGHKSLMETSVQAITNAAPFAPLPSDFPENYLEVTGRFTYYIKR